LKQIPTTSHAALRYPHPQALGLRHPQSLKIPSSSTQRQTRYQCVTNSSQSSSPTLPAIRAAPVAHLTPPLAIPPSALRSPKARPCPLCRPSSSTWPSYTHSAVLRRLRLRLFDLLLRKFCRLIKLYPFIEHGRLFGVICPVRAPGKAERGTRE
jgi:hypothetical protein